MDIINFEKEILEFWKKNEIFEKIALSNKNHSLFIPYNVPYEANSLPNINHVLFWCFNDLINRYKTMQGFKIKRKSIWNSYNPSIEIKTKQFLKINDITEIENYGKDCFKEKCELLSNQYKQDWENLMTEIGFWIKVKDIYTPYENNYIEEVWRIIKQIAEKNFLYYGSKTISYCNHCQTSLNSHEIIYSKQKSCEEKLALCWICNNKLSYQTENNWFIKTKEIKHILFENNQKINWTPNYIKKDIDKWIDTLEDWIISKKLYWGIPLPIWKCQKCKFLKIITNRQEIIEQQTEKNILNQYLILRPGQASFQEKFRNFTCSEWPEAIHCPLTNKGRQEIESLAKEIKEKNIKIDLIFSSDFLRAKQTAEIIAKKLDIKVNLCSELREINYGTANQSLIEGKDNKNFYNLDLFYKQSKDHETWNICFKRMIGLLEKIEQSYTNKTILIISHGDPLLILEARFKNLSNQEILDVIVNNKKTNFKYIKPGELRKIELKHLPVNLKGEIDLNSPYIDKIKLTCPKCNQLMERVKEKIDPCFSLSLFPFIQKNHFSIDKNPIKKEFALIDLIFSGVTPLKNWHYNLLIINALLNVKNLYKTIVLLDPIINPADLLSFSKILKQKKADIIRLYLYSSDPLKEIKIEIQGLKEITNCIDCLWNIFLLFSSYVNKDFIVKEKFFIKNELDLWIISEINILNDKLITNLEKYEIRESSILIKNFINNFANIYIKYSYSKIYYAKTNEEKNQVFQVIYYVLFNFIKLTAPFIPFITEKIYQGLKKYNIEVQKQSIHMNSYPQARQRLINIKTKQKMEKIKKIIDLGLIKRKEKGIKITQPLLKLDIFNQELYQELLSDKIFTSILKQELNVKEISYGKSLEFDYKISPELKEEGIFQEIIFQAKKIAKITNLPIKDKINIFYQTNNSEIKELIKKWNNYYRGEKNTFINFINKIEFVSKKPKNIEYEKKLIFNFPFKKPPIPLKPKQVLKKSKKLKKTQSQHLKEQKTSVWIGIQIEQKN